MEIMQINLCPSINLSKLFFINYIFLVGALAFSSERDDHLPSIKQNQVAPITDDSRHIVSPPQSLEMDVRKDYGEVILVNSFFSVSTEE